MPTERSEALIQTIKKISIFKGLSPAQVPDPLVGRGEHEAVGTAEDGEPLDHV